MVELLIITVLVTSSATIWAATVISRQEKLIAKYEEAIDSAINNLSAADQIAAFGFDHDIGVNSKAVHEQSRFVLNNLRRDKQSLK